MVLVPDAICRDLEAVLEEGYKPREDDGFRDAPVALFKMKVPYG